MTKKELLELRQSVMERIYRWIAKGGKVGTYKCNHCKNKIPVCIPSEKDVSSKGFWDSATICVECGKMNFVCEYPSGKTLSKIIK